jgi:molybdate transport system regulatory protein
MSYKRAWSLVEETNEIFDRDVIERQIGGNRGGSTALTDFGRELIERYHHIEHAATEATRDDLAALEANTTRRKQSS